MGVWERDLDLDLDPDLDPDRSRSELPGTLVRHVEPPSYPCRIGSPA
jgi:hypothetical protein